MLAVTMLSVRMSVKSAGIILVKLLIPTVATLLATRLFAGLASLAYAAAIPTIQPGTGAGLELDAIGGAIVGGVSPTGGAGSVIGTMLGVFVIQLLKTGLPYIGLEANWQQIVTGLVLIGAVLIDVIKQRRAALEA